MLSQGQCRQLRETLLECGERFGEGHAHRTPQAEGGVGAWHVPLAAGGHFWKMVFSDGRCWLASGELAPGAFYGLWRDYPQPWSTNPAKLPSQLSYTWPGRTGETAFTPDLFLHSADEC